jgi:hypothetical protein
MRGLSGNRTAWVLGFWQFPAELQIPCEMMGLSTTPRPARSERRRVEHAHTASTKSLKPSVVRRRPLVTVECADCHHDHDSRPRPERMVATKNEIDRAIEMLTPAQWQQLKNFAAWRVRGLGRAGLGRTGDDLFQEAWVSTLTGAEGTGEGRRWNKSGVDFFGYLRGAMRGISWGWKQKFNE